MNTLGFPTNREEERKLKERKAIETRRSVIGFSDKPIKDQTYQERFCNLLLQ
jgi:hypothetical protein